MSNIQKLTYPYFTDGTTQLNAANLNPIISKMNEMIEAINSGATPTPTQTVATPTISISGTTATISCSTSGATIYYTTNGNTPTTSSSVYSSAITLTQSCTIKAIAVKSGMTNSSVASKTYTPSMSPEATAAIAKFNNMSAANQTKLETFVDTLVSAGIYSKIHYLMLPIVAGSVAEGLQNVLSSTTPPAASQAEIANGGLHFTGAGQVDITSLINGTPDYENFSLGVSLVVDSEVANGSTPRALTFNVASSGSSPVTTAVRVNQAGSSAIQYTGYNSTGKVLNGGVGVVTHDSTLTKEIYYTNSTETEAADNATISATPGFCLGSDKTISESQYRGQFSGTYKVIVFSDKLSSTEMATLYDAIVALQS